LFALILGATCMLFSVLLRLNTLFQPNSLDVLCWVTFCFVIIKVINSGDRKWFIAGAVVFAIGFLNKYNMAFLIAGIFPAILLTRQRQLLYTRSFGISFFIALLVILPNLLWQYNHGFPVIG